MDLFEEPAEEKGERAGGEEDHVEELAEARERRQGAQKPVLLHNLIGT